MNEKLLADHVHRYFLAVYGKDYVYWAPETYTNALERWLLYTAHDTEELAEKTIQEIENWVKEHNNV